MLRLHFKELPLSSLTVVNAFLPLVQICDLASLIQTFNLQTLLLTVQDRGPGAIVLKGPVRQPKFIPRNQRLCLKVLYRVCHFKCVECESTSVLIIIVAIVMEM